MIRKIGLLIAGISISSMLVGAGTLMAPAASAATTGQVFSLDVNKACAASAKRLDLTGMHVGDTLILKNVFTTAGANASLCAVGDDQDHVGTVTTVGFDWVITFVSPSSQAFLRFDTSPATANLMIVTVEVLAVPEEAPVAGQATYTVNLDPEDGGTCTVASVTGAGGSWVRLPNESACTKPGYRFIGWQARHTNGPPTTLFPAYSYINLTADNTLYAQWAPVEEPVVAPVRLTRWVVWRMNPQTHQLQPVSADLMDVNPVVTIHAPKASAVNASMVKAAKALASANGGTYEGIVTATKWASPRIVTAYTR